MPIFEYECLNCREKFERFTKKREPGEKITCPSCGYDWTKRIFSAFNASSTNQSRSCDTTKFG